MTEMEKIPLIPGFQFSALTAGIKKTHKKDLALILSEQVSTVAGVFTTNKIKAAPVRLDLRRIGSQKGQAIIINSGNANACTGSKGLKDARETAEITARKLGIPSELVYVSSTGLIGRHLPMMKIRKAIPGLVKRLSPSSLREVSEAILTTDTFPKLILKKIRLGGKTGTIAGIAKGAGMICPNMATLLSFIMTDIAVEKRALDSALKNAIDHSFNRLTIDTDMSTNDTVLIMANGMLKNRPITRNSHLYLKLERVLLQIACDLSRMIAQDGEGATKVIDVVVKGARTVNDAQKVAMAIAKSLLVRTAIYGEDPNWGRIMAAIGYAGVNVKEEKINIAINGFKLVNRGIGRKKPQGIFSGREIVIAVHLGLGRQEAKVLTCDLTEGYIKINASYMT